MDHRYIQAGETTFQLVKLANVSTGWPHYCLTHRLCLLAALVEQEEWTEEEMILVTSRYSGV